MGWSFFLRREALSNEKAVRRYAQRRVVMETAPTASLEMPQAEFLLELLVVALDAPTQLGESHEFFDRRVSGQRTQEILAWLDFGLWPLDEQPLLIGDIPCLCFARDAKHPCCRKARRQGAVGPFTPGEGAKASRWQLHGQLFRLQRRLAF